MSCCRINPYASELTSAGSCSRKEAEEEVVQGEGYATGRRNHKTRDRIDNRAVKDKAVHAVEFDKILEEKLNKEATVARLLSIAILVDRTKINGSLARHWLEEKCKDGTLKAVVHHRACKIYGGLSYSGIQDQRLTVHSAHQQGCRCRVDVAREVVLLAGLITWPKLSLIHI